MADAQEEVPRITRRADMQGVGVDSFADIFINDESSGRTKAKGFCRSIIYGLFGDAGFSAVQPATIDGENTLIVVNYGFAPNDGVVTRAEGHVQLERGTPEYDRYLVRFVKGDGE